MKKKFHPKEHQESQRRNLKIKLFFVNFCALCDKKILLITSLLFLLSILASCTNFPYPTTPPETPTTETEITAESPTPSTEETPISENNAPKILRVWLPPQFSPEAETDAAAILRARLDSFQKRRPDLILEIRIKAVEGEVSLLNALIATHQAAPSAMPDLVALPRPNLESAVQAGILHPIDGITTLLDDPDWFPYARPLAHIQNSAYGLPFAANLLGLRYLPEEDFPLPILEELEITFAADNPKSALSFCLYDEANIEEESLTNLLTFYQSENIAKKSAEYQNNADILETPAILWSSDFLNETPAEAIFAPVPNPAGDTCSLADAWLWTLAGSDPDLQLGAAELAEYLSQSDFLSEWTSALGMLPPRPTALDENETLLHELSLVAQAIPSNDTVDSLGEKFRVATMSVLQDQVDPSTASQEMLESLQ